MTFWGGDLGIGFRTKVITKEKKKIVKQITKYLN